jgi:formyltetrahydrofolate-dependent phosphoribosylglycinamide formyltransferase
VPLRVAVLLSGEGTSLQNLFEQIDAGLPARVAVVIASKPDVGGLVRAERRGVPAIAVPRRLHRDVHAFNDALHGALARFEIDLVALLGFLSPFQPRERFAGRVINVHPALIPAFSGHGFYGHRVHEAVLESGVKVTGATVHFADDEYDHGPIIFQEAVGVRDDDTPETLAARVQAVERRLVPEAIRLIAEGRLAVEGRRVRIKEDESRQKLPKGE